MKYEIEAIVYETVVYRMTVNLPDTLTEDERMEQMTEIITQRSEKDIASVETEDMEWDYWQVAEDADSGTPCSKVSHLPEEESNPQVS